MLDEKKAYDAWVARNKATCTFSTVFDTAGRGAKSLATGAYDVAGIPAQYVIDKVGRVAEAWVGFDEGDNHLETALVKQGISLPPEAASHGK